MNSQRDDLQRHFCVFEIIQQQPDAAAFEWQMPRAERTGALRKYKQFATGPQLIETLAQRRIIQRLIAFILGPCNGDPIAKNNRANQLLRNCVEIINTGARKTRS